MLGRSLESKTATASRASGVSLHLAQCLLLKTEKPGIQDREGLVQCSTASSNSVQFEPRSLALLSLLGYLVSVDPSFILIPDTETGHLMRSSPAAKE